MVVVMVVAGNQMEIKSNSFYLLYLSPSFVVIAYISKVLYFFFHSIP